MIRPLAVALVLVLAACTSDKDSSAASGTAAPVTSALGGSASGFTQVDPGDAECAALWSGTDIEAAAGKDLALTGTTTDGTACTYADDDISVVVFLREGDRSEFDAVKDDVAATSEVVELDVCDGGYSAEITPTFGVVEALDLESGRIYNVTVNGVDDPSSIAVELMAAVC